MTTHEATANTEVPQEPRAEPAIPSQFETVEALSAAYAELRAKMDAGTPETASQPAQATPAPTEGGTSQLTLESATAAHTASESIPAVGQERLAEMATEYASTGKLSDASLAEANATFGAPVVQQYMAGVEAQTQLHVGQIYDAAGGEQQYGQLAGWIAGNSSQAEQAAYNAVVDSRDTQAALLAVQGMKARMAQAIGVAPESTVGGTRGGVQGVFQNSAEMVVAQQDPRYSDMGPGGDAYRADFQRKVEAAMNAGNL